MLKKLFYLIFLVGLLYTGSCFYTAYRFFVPAEPTHSERRLKLDADSLPPLSESHSGQRLFDADELTGLAPAPKATRPWKLNATEATRADEEFGNGVAPFTDFDDYTPPPAPLLAAFCAPGLFVLHAFGFEAASTAAWLVIGVFSWAIWSVGLRTAWIIPARKFGWGYSPRAFRFWLWLGIPWRPVFAFLRPLVLWLRLLRIGKIDADRWAGFFWRAEHTFKPGHILLGRQSFCYLPCLQPIGLATERGATIVSAPGAGKSTWLTSHLSMYPGNFAVVDCDAGIYRTLSDYLRRQKKRVLVYDPLGLTRDSCSFNPLDEVLRAMWRYGDDAAVEFAAVLAQGLIKETYGENSWISADARAFMKALILYVCRYASPENRNLVYLRRLLVLGHQSGLRPKDDPFFSLLASMRMRVDDWGGAIAAAAEAMRRSFSKNDGRSIPLSYCIEQTQMFDMPPLARLSLRSDFETLDLKADKDVCLFLVMPLQAMSGPLAGIVRVLFTQMIYAFQRDTQHRPAQPTALCLDEAAHIGLDQKLVSLALAGLRKYGLVVYSIFQNVAQMGDNAADYLGLSEVNLFMSTNDQGVLDYLSSHALGSATRLERIPGNWPFGIEPRHQRENRRLASPTGVKLLLKDHVIVTRADAAPMLLKPIKHYLDLPVSWTTPDLHYGEKSRARAFTRRVLRFFTGRQALPPARPSTRRRKETRHDFDE